VPHTPRHALRRSRSAALLPGLLILAAGSAFGGMAVLPGPAAADGGPRSDGPRRTADAGLSSASGAQVAVQVAQDRQDERASRDRRPAPVPTTVPTPEPAVAAPAPPPPPLFVRPGTGRLTSGYGSRWGRLHAGIDLAAGVGAPISAAAAGTVVAAGSEGGYGRVVRLQHDDDTVTVYAHLSELHVTAGQRVTAGTWLGLEGSSGHSTGPHLHFEVRVGDVPVDPAPWLRARGVDPAAQPPQ
jgi:murein DD-endopeptidase MepM/ murein hydrolase activator NlpD